MVIADSVIYDNLAKLKAEIGTVNSTLKTLVALQAAFIKIQIVDKRVSNNTGGYDIIQTIPNTNNLSKEDNDQIRQIIYDDSIAKFTNLNL